VIPSVRAAVLRQAAILAVVLLAIGMAITGLSSGWENATRQIGWAIALSVGVAAFAAWQTAGKAKKGFIAGTNPGFALVPVEREGWPGIDWGLLEEETIRLEARGYRRLGDFTINRQATDVRGMARFLADPAGTRIVELQQFERLAPTPLMGDEHFAVRFTIGSVIGGRIRVMVTDRPVHPAIHLVRGDSTVAASYPGKSLLELIELHRRLVEFVAQRTGKSVDSGFTLERYVLLEREKQAQVRARLERASGWALLSEIDRFSANPAPSYSPPEAYLKSLPVRGWEELEREIGATVARAQAMQAASAPEDAQSRALRERMVSGAHWFYWIAGLSAVNAIAAALGSTWGFVIGLGLTQVLSAVVMVIAEQPEPSAFALAIVWILTFGVIALFALFGWLAQRPSVAAFVIGGTLFALDTLIFVVAFDLVGIAFHVLALYFLWRGLAAAREMKRQAAPAAAVAPAA